MATTAASSSQAPGAVASSAPALTLAGVAAVLASGCCVAPLLLALAGISGTWISQLRRIEPYSPWLLGLSFAALGAAAWRLFRRPAQAAACAADGVDCRRRNGVARRWFWVVALLAIVPLVVPLAAPWFY